ncbi:hypothetical protein MDAP_001306 [Mitosporidium daphniae]
MERLTRLLKGPLDDPKASEISSSRFSAKELSGGYDEKQTTKPFAHSGHIQCSDDADDADDSEHVEANHNVETTGAFGPPEGSEVAGVSLAPQVDKTMATSSTQANNGNSPDVFITIEDSRFKVDANLEKSEDKDKNFNSDKDIDKIKVDSRIISRLDNLKKEYEKMKHEPDSSILKGIPFCSATKNNILGIHFIAAVFAAVSGPMCFSGSLKDQCYGSIVGIIAAILLYFTEISILFNRTQSSYLVYVYNGILPLVPGGNFVKETFGIIEDMVVGDYEHPEKKDFAKTKYPPFMSSIVSAFSIGLGIIVSDSIYNLLKKSLLKLKKVVTFYQILLK